MKRDLPPYVYQKPAGLYFQRRHWQTVRINAEPGTPAFWAEYEAILHGPVVSKGDHPMTTPGGSCHLSAIEAAARKRAARRGLECTLPAGSAHAQFKRQSERCAVSGLRMYKDREKHAPWAPSIDRKDSARGYTPNNCQLVAYIVNCARNQFTDAEFLAMCRAVVGRLG